MGFCATHHTLNIQVGEGHVCQTSDTLSNNHIFDQLITLAFVPLPSKLIGAIEYAYLHIYVAIENGYAIFALVNIIAHRVSWIE